MFPVELEVPLPVELLVELLAVEAPPAMVELEAGSEGEVVSFSGIVIMLCFPPLWAIA